jgi:hypothetical protein
MKKIAFLLLVALVSCSSLVWAFGPVRKEVSLDQIIAAPPQEVWAALGRFHDMSWHPAVASTDGRGGNAPGATRTLTLVNGGQILERLERYDPRTRSLFYRIEQVDPKVLPVTGYSSWISVSPGPEGSSLVTWKGAFYRADLTKKPAPDLDDRAAVDAITGIYKSGLLGLKALVERGDKALAAGGNTTLAAQGDKTLVHNAK